MSVFMAEFRKLIGSKFFVALMALLLVINGVVCVFTIQSADRDFNDTMDLLCKEYNENPEESLEKYTQMFLLLQQKAQEYFAEKSEESRKLMAEGKPGLTMEEMQYHSYEIDGKNDDRQLVATLIYKVGAEDRFVSDVNVIISQAYAMMTQGKHEGLTMEDYAYKYQAYAYNTYQNVKEQVILPTTNTYGWEAFFSYRYVDVFVFAAVLLLAGMFLFSEKQYGMMPMLKSMKRGRGQVGIAKVGMAAVMSVLISAVMIGTVFGVVFIKSGFSDISVPVQCLDSLKLCPYIISIGEYLGIFLFTKILGYMAFTLLILMISRLFCSPVMSYIGGAGILILSYFVSNMEFPKYPILKVLNLFSIVNVTEFTAKLSVLNLFGSPKDCIHLAWIVCAVLFVVCAAVTVLWTVFDPLGQSMKSGSPLLAKLSAKVRMLSEKAKSVFRKQEKKKEKVFKTHAHSVFFFENYKLVRYGGVLILLLILLGAEIFLSSSEYKTAPGNYQNMLYVEIIENYNYKGELNEERAKEIKKRRDDAKAIVDQSAAMLANYESGSISAEEYSMYLKKYNSANSELSTLGMLVKRVNYLEEKHEETGIWGWLCDTLAYEELFSVGVDLPMYGALLLLGAVIFSMERNGKGKNDSFYAILRSTKNGRKRTFYSKFAAVAGGCTLLFLIFFGIRIYYFTGVYSFDADSLNAPLFSIQSLKEVSGGVTVGQYLWFYLLMQLPIVLLLAVFITSVSALSPNLMAALGISAFSTAIPTALAMLGLDFGRYLNFGGWMGVNDMSKHSFAVDWFGSDFGYFILFSGVFALLSVTLAVFARKKFVK